MTSVAHEFDQAFASCPLIAILRGLTPAEAPEIGQTLVDAGFTLIEVPLNSPKAFESIGKLANLLKGRALVGAGTVINVDQVQRVAAAGGQLIVSPNTDVAVIHATAEANLASLPGFYTATEAFAALGAGATALKLFPADAATPAMLKAHRAVLPRFTRVVAVGGITPAAMPTWQAAGADGFGLGSNLFTPGKSASSVRRDAISFTNKIKDSR